MVDRLENRPKPSSRPAVVLMLVLVLAGVAVWAEGRRRAPAEQAALRACADQAVDAASSAERRVAATASYVLPVLGTRGQRLDRSMLGLISREAGRGVGAVEEALAECRAVRPWWFNRSHVETRDAYVAFLVAQRTRLVDVLRDGYAFGRDYDDVRRLEDEAAATLER